MTRLTFHAVILLTAAWMAAPGCSQAPSDAKKPAASTDPAKNDPLAALSKEDREAVLKQGICPVSDEKLGGDMGLPIKVVIEGRDVWVCCESCIEDLKKDPAKYLAKLDAPAGAGRRRCRRHRPRRCRP